MLNRLGDRSSDLVLLIIAVVPHADVVVACSSSPSSLKFNNRSSVMHHPACP